MIITGLPIKLKVHITKISPGIGKSTFLYYQLAQCLSMGWPTIIYDGLTIYFDTTGAYKMHFNDNMDFEPFEGMDQTMCLIDSDHNPLPPRLWISKLLFPILNFKKQSELRRIIPKAPSFEEALQVWNQASDSSKIELLKYFWNTYSPDFCLGKKVAYMGEQALIEHNALIDKELYPLGYTELLKVVRNPDSSASLSHKLVFLYSTNQEPTVLRHHLCSGMLMRLIIEITTARCLEDHQLLFIFFQHSPSMAPSLGHLFKIIIQTFNNKSAPSATMFPFKFYVLQQKNNKAYTGFHYDGWVSYGFQKTVSNTHLLNKKGMLDLCRHMEVASMQEFLFIIVTL
ncbi:hypothetical protein GYMLUDRAFT_74714 [Collybiopsis luxurians FD-317 M1]|uniref:Uncharacterized protein n=1 Tax=Collybiopsis luxurians FD-317 M1 TaxID=944289 RepID=A0A0D0C8N2_9AGAR|nr:hypothetical protein GYMLUDRAFT_74714 [Collybiopsis luxurians FD-317 M1]